MIDTLSAVIRCACLATYPSVTAGRCLPLPGSGDSAAGSGTRAAARGQRHAGSGTRAAARQLRRATVGRSWPWQKGVHHALLGRRDKTIFAPRPAGGGRPKSANVSGQSLRGEWFGAVGWVRYVTVIGHGCFLTARLQLPLCL